MIEHVVFDFFGTLVHYRPGMLDKPLVRARNALQRLGTPLSHSQLVARWDACFRVLEAEAQRTHIEYSMRDSAGLLFRGLGVSPTEPEISHFITEFLADWNEGVTDIDALDDFLGRVALAKSVLSNTHAEDLVPGHLDRLGVSHHFDCVTTSVGLGVRKPHPNIYLHHLRLIGSEPARTLFVGDNPVCDYFGPMDAGMQALLIAPAAVPGVPEAHRVGHLFEVAEWLDQPGRSR
jgi:putative hydrolase of the HAD superfamily